MSWASLLLNMRDSLKLFVAQRAQWCCEYCLTRADHSSDPFAIEHLIPRVLGGTDEPDNLAFSCLGCNNFKFTAIEALDAVSGLVVALFNPRSSIWDEHFLWTENYSNVEGITPMGRATVQRLRLNRPGLTNLRIALAVAGKHPPF